MRSLTVLLLLSLAVFVFADEEKDEHVLDLTKDNFESTITENEMVLVKFYAPWCGHCKSFAPEYSKAAKTIAEEGSKIKLGKVDATVHTELATKYQIQGYPTIKFFRNGEPIDYNGPRQAEGVVSWLKKKTGPPLAVVTAKEELEKLKKDNRVLAVVLSTDEKGAEFKAIEAVASKTDSISFVHVTDAALAKELGHSGSTLLVLFKHFDEPKVDYTGTLDEEGIKKFLREEKVPLVTEFTQESAQAVFESDIKVHIIAFSGKSGDSYKSHLEILKAVGKDLKGKCHVVVIDMDDAETQRVGEFFGVTSKDVPTFRVLQMNEQMVKYQPDKTDFTSEYLIQFTKDVLDGKVKPHLKSQEEPEDWNKEPVKVLVAKTFKERAVIKDKAVFVEFYAPWCGHCKALTPIWDALAKENESKDDVVIAKCDATENEFEDIKINSFPTLKFSPKGSEEWLDYSGERTQEALQKYLDSNGKAVDEPKKEEEEKHDEL